MTPAPPLESARTLSTEYHKYLARYSCTMNLNYVPCGFWYGRPVPPGVFKNILNLVLNLVSLGSYVDSFIFQWNLAVDLLNLHGTGTKI
eukprot:SAG31_NODE_1413_length_8459_cov_7.720215_8_plen_89_part_00